jgi:hypothetical protein
VPIERLIDRFSARKGLATLDKPPDEQTTAS